MDDRHDATTSSDAYREFFERAPDAFLILEDGVIVDCNDATAAMLGHRCRDQILQRTPADLSPRFQPDGRPSPDKAEEMIELALAGGSHRFLWRHRRADGEDFPAEVTLTPVSKGDRVVLHTTWRDLTRVRRLEEELRLARRFETVGKLADGIAHELNNVLMGVNGNAELVEMDMDPESPLADSIRDIRLSGQKAAELVARILAFSHCRTAARDRHDLSEEVRLLAPVLTHFVGSAVVLDLTLDEGPLPVRADGDQLERVAFNLVANADEAMPDGGRLTVETLRAQLRGDALPGTLIRPGDYAVLRVRDTGEGIPVRDVERIFDPFFTTRDPGRGLGLSAVQSIVHPFGGDVLVESRRGEGTTMSVYLPLLDADTEVQNLKDATTADEARGPRTVLLVEDDASVAAVARKILELEGYRVHLAADGHEAVRLVEEEDPPIDLLFTDVVMPNMGGPELARCLRVLRPDVSVLFSSGFTDAALRERKLLEGEVALLRKPFSRTDLISAVRKALGD